MIELINIIQEISGVYDHFPRSRDTKKMLNSQDFRREVVLNQKPIADDTYEQGFLTRGPWKDVGKIVCIKYALYLIIRECTTKGAHIFLYHVFHFVNLF